jgi:DNA adenine methylase
MESNVRVRAFGAHFTHRKQRPLAQWFGGDLPGHDQIIRHFPSRHRVYVEPFGGVTSLLLHKPRSLAEIYNDADQDIVNLFQVMRDPLRLVRLIELVRWTPLARDEFSQAIQDANEPIEQARRMLMRSWAALRSSRANRWAETQRHAEAGRRWVQLPSNWRSVPEALRLIAERLCGVIIEKRDPCQVIVDYDSPQTLFYVSPPGSIVRPCLRNRKVGRLEPTEADDLALAKTLSRVRGHVVLRGCDSEFYRDLYPGWRLIRLGRGTVDARRNTNALWLSPGIREAHHAARSAEERRS